MKDLPNSNEGKELSLEKGGLVPGKEKRTLGKKRGLICSWKEKEKRGENPHAKSSTF